MDKIEHRKNESYFKADEIQFDISETVHEHEDSPFHHSRECSSTIKRKEISEDSPLTRSVFANLQSLNVFHD